jgi:hypothetical protein
MECLGIDPGGSCRALDFPEPFSPAKKTMREQISMSGREEILGTEKG